MGVRNNRPSLKSAARRIFAPIWSGRRHPIYRLIEAADEKQLLCLRPEIRKCIEFCSVLSRSGYRNQHQGLDAILEEINKALKALIPPTPSQRHWEIAARNCTKFIKVSILNKSKYLSRILYLLFCIVASHIIQYNWTYR